MINIFIFYLTFQMNKELNLYLITFEMFMIMIFVFNLYIFTFKKYNIYMLLFYCLIQLVIIFLNSLMQFEDINNWLHTINIILIYLSIYDICLLYKQNRNDLAEPLFSL
jgi:hypothetical protein